MQTAVPLAVVLVGLVGCAAPLEERTQDPGSFRNPSPPYLVSRADLQLSGAVDVDRHCDTFDVIAASTLGEEEQLPECARPIHVEDGEMCEPELDEGTHYSDQRYAIVFEVNAEKCRAALRWHCSSSSIPVLGRWSNVLFDRLPTHLQDTTGARKSCK